MFEWLQKAFIRIYHKPLLINIILPFHRVHSLVGDIRWVTSILSDRINIQDLPIVILRVWGQNRVSDYLYHFENKNSLWQNFSKANRLIFSNVAKQVSCQHGLVNLSNLDMLTVSRAWVIRGVRQRDTCCQWFQYKLTGWYSSSQLCCCVVWHDEYLRADRSVHTAVKHMSVTRNEVTDIMYNNILSLSLDL
jgi:hypothetical protein